MFNDTKWYKDSTDEFLIVGDGVLIKYNGNEENVIVPDTVKCINNAFEDMLHVKNIKSIVIPDSVTKVTKMALGNTSLQKVTFGKNVEYIGQDSFCECSSLEEVILPESLKYIGNQAFAYTAIKELTLPDNVETIDGAAFLNCEKLTKLTLNEGVKYIGLSIISGTALTELYFPDSINYISPAPGLGGSILFIAKANSYPAKYAREREFINYKEIE